jgi:hypothetical protein
MYDIETVELLAEKEEDGDVARAGKRDKSFMEGSEIR